jgi:hypothetical protein
MIALMMKVATPQTRRPDSEPRRIALSEDEARELRDTLDALLLDP